MNDIYGSGADPVFLTVPPNGHAQTQRLGQGSQIETQKGLLDLFRRVPMPMPRSQSELFRLLASYNPLGGWDAFVRMIDFSNVTRRQIYQVVLGRPPESAAMALPHPNYDPAVHFTEALLSREFRRSVQSVFLRAHPAKGRDVFIHIPKCAGTDLILNLGARSVPLPKMLELEDWTSEADFLEILGGLSRAAISAERLFAYGHMELGEYVDLAGVRPDDRIFTVLRDPVDQLISQANYAVGRMRQDPAGKNPDTAEYLKLLGLTGIPPAIGFGDLKDLTIKALLNPLIAEPNRACFYLGRGSQAHYATAMQNVIVHDVEITTTDCYERWLRDRWNIAESVRHNRSEAILPNAEARRLCGATLADAGVEDRKLFDVVAWALRQSGGASVTGQQLARLLGPPLTETLKDNVIPAVAAETPKDRKPGTILVADDEEHVAMYLAPVSIDVPGQAALETVLSVGVCANTGVEDYLGEGWGLPEESFTWTADVRATVLLPVLPKAGTTLVRLVVSPFVAEDRLASQHVDLAIGEVSLGGCRVKDRSVIEAVVPPALLASGTPLTLTLHLPDAARPSDILESDDKRFVALAVHHLSVLRAGC